MKTKIILLFTFFIFLLYSIIDASSIDSLKNQLEHHKTEDTTRFNLLILYSNVLQYQDTAVSVAKGKEALQLAQKLNFHLGIYKAYRQLGNLYLPRSDYKMALYYAQKAIKQAVEINDTVSAQIMENNIAQIYAMMGDFINAVPGFKKFYQVALQSHNEKSIAMALNNIALCYLNMEITDSAITYLNKVIASGEKLKDPELLSYGYVNLGAALDKKEKYTDAKQNFEKGLSIAEKNQITPILIQAATGLSEVNFYLKNYSEAEKFALQGIELSKKANIIQGQFEAYKLLTDIYQKQNKYKEAFDAYQNYVTVSDSLRVEGKKQIEIVRKEQEFKRSIEKEQADAKIRETEIRNKFLWFSLSFVVIIALLTFIFYKRQRDVKQKIEKQNALLKQGNEIRQRISRDLHDEIGAGLTQISMKSTRGKVDFKQQINVEPSFDSIIDESIKLGKNLTGILWTTNPDNDNLESLLIKIRTYSNEFLENSNVNLHIEISDKIDSFPTNPEVNRNIYLILKEGLNNIVKHSEAKMVNIKFSVDDLKNFKLVIADNGKGFDTNTPTNRNGKKILEQRATSIKNGRIELKSEIGNGTTIIVEGNLS